MPDVLDLPDLPDLAGDVRSRVVVPPYDEVSRRVRARRLRTLTGTLAATAVVVAGLAGWQNAATTASPSPQPPVTQPDPTDDSWRDLVVSDQAAPFEQAGTEDGSVAVIWRNLVHPEPTFALVIRRPDGSVVGEVIDFPVTLTPVPGGWVGVSTARGWFIATDGTWTDLGTPGDARQPRPGDVFVDGQPDSYLYSSSAGGWSRYPSEGVEIRDDYVTPDGHLVTCGVLPGGLKVWRSGSLRHSSSVGDTASCLIAGAGSAVVVARLGDSPDGDIPLEGVLRSVDGGLTWLEVDYPVMSSVSSLVVMADGAWATGSTSGELFVAPDRFTGWTLVDHGVAFAAGDRLFTLHHGQSKGPWSYSDDLGVTWQQVPAPGMGSSEE